MESLDRYNITDTTETLDGELRHGMTDALLDLHIAGQISLAEITDWSQTGRLSDTAHAALAAAACANN
jgi:hypothetical protein